MGMHLTQVPSRLKPCASVPKEVGPVGGGSVVVGADDPELGSLVVAGGLRMGDEVGAEVPLLPAAAFNFRNEAVALIVLDCCRTQAQAQDRGFKVPLPGFGLT